MKIARRVLLTCVLIGSLAPPIFFLAVAHFHLESETAEWLVSLMPNSVPLEDRRAAADMAVTYGEMAAADMLTYTAVVWCAIFIYTQFFRRPKKEDRAK
jgi:hypothetical protein